MTKLRYLVCIAFAVTAGRAHGAEEVLQIAGAGVRAGAFRIADLEAMKPVQATWTAGGGKRVVVGVPIARLLEKQGLVPGRMGDDGSEHGKGWRRLVVASAPDGFQAVFSVAELTPHLGATSALVAWKIDGKPVPADRGPLRLVVLTDKIGSRSVHSVNRLEVMELPDPAPGPAPHGSTTPAPKHGPTGRATSNSSTTTPAPKHGPTGEATSNGSTTPAPKHGPTGGGPVHGSTTPAPEHGPTAGASSHVSADSEAHEAGAAAEALVKVGAIHGAAGPFAVAGYRMGQRALRELGLPSGSVDLEVRHESPAEVQWSCIADGAQAATGASAGKLNLSLKQAPRDRTRTIFRRKSTGKSIAFSLHPTFVRRFIDLPREQLPRAGHDIMSLPDEAIFTVTRP